MAAAGIIDVEDELRSLRTTVTDLIESVAHLTQDLAGLMAERDGGVYGVTYATDRGPAVRALFFELNASATQENARRASMLHDQVAGLEATIAELTGIQTTYNLSLIHI